MKMSCELPRYVDWRSTSVCLVLEAITGLILSILWGFGFIEQMMEHLCRHKGFYAHFAPINLAACGFYTMSSFSAIVALLGLLSGYFQLQRLHNFMSLARLVLTMTFVVISLPTECKPCTRLTFYPINTVFWIYTIINVCCLVIFYKQYIEDKSMYMEGTEEEKDARPLRWYFRTHFERELVGFEESDLGVDVPDGKPRVFKNRSASSSDQETLVSNEEIQSADEEPSNKKMPGRSKSSNIFKRFTRKDSYEKLSGEKENVSKSSPSLSEVKKLAEDKKPKK